MTTSSTRPAVVVPVHEMVVVHRILRQEFARLADLVRHCPDGHVGRARGIGEHADFVMAALHHHHGTEDELLWPLLLDRARPQADLVHRMERQHRAVAGCLDRVRELLAGWRVAPTAASGRAVADALGELSAALAEHLDDEETHILPLVSRHVTLPEWQRIGERSFAKFSPAQKLLALGLMLDVATPEEAVSFLAGLPWPIRVIWWGSGRRRYARYVARTEGRSDPTPRRWMRRAHRTATLRRSLSRTSNRLGVWMYRRLDGRLSSGRRDVQVLVITTPGRRTGVPRSTCVRYLDTPDGLLVWGTGSGSRRDPDWFENLRQADTAEIRVRDRTCRIRPRELSGDDRAAAWHDVVLVRAPEAARYARRARRTIPVALLEPL